MAKKITKKERKAIRQQELAQRGGMVMSFDGNGGIHHTNVDDMMEYHNQQRKSVHDDFFGEFEPRLSNFSHNLIDYDYQKQYECFWHDAMTTEELKDISFIKTVGAVTYLDATDRLKQIKDSFLQTPFLEGTFDMSVLNTLITVEWINAKNNTGKINLFIGTDCESVECYTAHGRNKILSKEAFNWMMLIWQSEAHGLNMERSIFHSMISFSEADLFEFGIDKELHPAIIKNMPYPDMRGEGCDILAILD